jgi:hypothetical protein
MSKQILVLGLAAVLGTATAPAAETEHHAPAPAAADERFEFLKRLAGTWVAPEGYGDAPGGPFEFRVTAGGHAVEEREMVGTPMEMVTLYHLEGTDLVATHYCMMGNRPRMEAERGITDGTLVFSCAGKPGGARTHAEEHVHGWSMRLDDDGRLHYEAQMAKDGKVTEKHTVVLTRERETAAR